MSLFMVGVIIYAAHLMESMKELLELINELNKFTGCKINIQKYIVFLYISNDQLPTKI
jgi:hypothetical protein